VSKEQLEAEIRELRLEVGETVEALTERLDVKARMQEKARHVPRVPIAVLAVALVALVVWKKRS
jgi:hypothetical protein